MSRRCARAGLACLLAAGTIGASAPAPAAAVEVSMDRDQVSARLGESFGLRSTVTNSSPRPREDLVAHLNIVSLKKGVYVDPEDWSSERTQYLGALEPHESIDLSWNVEAVNGGEFAIYVVVVPGRNERAPAARLAASPAVDVRIEEHKTLNSGGVLPLALGIPALLGLLALGVRIRRRP
jgi:hypothetical protein